MKNKRKKGAQQSGVTGDSLQKPSQGQKASDAGSRVAVATESRVEFYRQSFAGPLPPPSMLGEYDQIIPGGAERILVMAEKQSEHRRDLEQHIVRTDAKRATSGLCAGFVLSFTTIVGGIVVAVMASPLAGVTMATAGVATLAAVFVYGTSSRRDEREKKSKQLSETLAPTVPEKSISKK